MTILHRPADELSDATIEQLYSSLGEHDTPKLFGQSFKVDIDHDVPTGGANSIDRKIKYIDRALYQEVMDGAFAATQLTPQQIINCWLDHEHSEICIVDGDNAIDTYEPAHQRALRREHEGVLVILGRTNAAAKIRRYEDAIWPGLMRAYHRDPKNPPADMWCGPLLDDPTDRDEELLEILRKLGVGDARKRSKEEVRYGFGKHSCSSCVMFKPEVISQEHKQIAACDAVSGLVRDTRWCQLWMPKAGTLFADSDAQQTYHDLQYAAVRPILLIRHGATKLNNDDVSVDRIRGWKDVPLSADGREEAKRLGHKLANSGDLPDVIVSSDLCRAEETAKIISQITGVPVAENNRSFRPWNVGKYAGQLSKDAIPILADYAEHQPATKLPDGESFNDFRVRFFNGLRDALRTYPGKLAIVTHHRDERLMNAWRVDGFQPSGEIAIKEFNKKGEHTGAVTEIDVPVERIPR